MTKKCSRSHPQLSTSRPVSRAYHRGSSQRIAGATHAAQLFAGIYIAKPVNRARISAAVYTRDNIRHMYGYRDYPPAVSSAALYIAYNADIPLSRRFRSRMTVFADTSLDTCFRLRISPIRLYRL